MRTVGWARILRVFADHGVGCLLVGGFGTGKRTEAPA
jgi:hypothetical protein